MAHEGMMLFTAEYSDLSAALADLATIEQLHDDELVGKYDAAVIDKENGRPHIVKRVDRPRMRVIPEAFGFGTLRRKELHEAAQELTAGAAGLIVIGEPTIEKGLDKAVDSATKVAKRTVDATSEEIADELKHAFSGAES